MHELVLRARVVREARDPRRDGRERALGALERDSGTHALGDQPARVGAAAHHDGELLAARAEDLLAAADGTPNRAPERAEHLVSRGMAVRVVDPLEVVEVEQDERGLRVAAESAAQASLQVLVEGAMVGEAGQQVVPSFGKGEGEPPCVLE